MPHEPRSAKGIAAESPNASLLAGCGGLEADSPVPRRRQPAPQRVAARGICPCHFFWEKIIEAQGVAKSNVLTFFGGRFGLAAALRLSLPGAVGQ